MYIQNGVVYAGKTDEEIKIVQIKPLAYGMLLLTFSTGKNDYLMPHP